jgi:16S rRNA (uracil1498-N3)-methyltransferase
MPLPYFFVKEISQSKQLLDEENSRHAISVLRMKKGSELLLTDGRGNKAKAIISGENKKACEVIPGVIETSPAPDPGVTIAISLVKNAARFEWFLEKSGELGVREVIPLLCERTEREKFRQDRMEGILISAMLQSQQSWLPHLHAPTAFDKVVKEVTHAVKLIAHCDDMGKISITRVQGEASSRCIMLIGPEGDFTKREIDLALENHFIPVSLGKTRLRTETAGMVAAAVLCLNSD